MIAAILAPVALAPGTRLGPYQIEGPLGAGGMGEVYLARDTRLERTVAIKVLPPHLAESPELLQRFEREARAASSLNHPNICTLFDVGREGGLHYLVMEHLQGETLARRIERGAVPVEEALTIAIQIADALDRAHRQGLVHRDLKPANVMLTRSGAKLLDFGLAKLAGPGVTDLTSAPTQASPLTAHGAIVGTFQYIAPEQLEGAPADARSDIFSFGATLYEMITGRRAFEGKTQASLAAAVLKETPRPISAIQPSTPPALERLVATCLAKDPEERRRTMHDVLLELRWIAKGSAAGERIDRDAPAVTVRRSREPLAWTIAAIAILAAAAALFLPRSDRASERTARTRLHAEISPPEGIAFDYRHGPMALSPDGTRVAFVGRDAAGERSLFVRALDEPEAAKLAGTVNADFPFWSPDGKSIGFFAAGRLLRIDADRGTPDVLAETGDGAGGAWGANGVILFASRTYRGIQRIAESGGKPETLTQPGPDDFGHRWPAWLPDGQHFLFSVRRGGGVNAVLIGSLDGAEPEQFIDVFTNAVFVPPDRILFWRDGALRIQPFDPRRRVLAGQPVAVAPGVRFAVELGAALYAATPDMLAYYTGGEETTQSRLVLRNRQGSEVGAVGVPGNYYSPRFSPDGRRVAVDNSGTDNNGDIWVYELARPGGTRLTFDAVDESDPVWSPTGDRIAFFSTQGGGSDVLGIRVSGSAKPEKLLATPAREGVWDWSPDGQHLAIESRLSNRDQRDLLILSLADGTTRPFADSPFEESHAKFSPDGRWLAFTSDETGRDEVYVRPFPQGEGKWRVSVAGGTTPRWRGDGRELFYGASDGKLMALPVTTSGSTFEPGSPQPLFATRLRFEDGGHYDVAPDGATFVFNEWVEERDPRPMSIVLGWNAEQATR
jgi:eukaryotic-like serine/threonine-protein kinase